MTIAIDFTPAEQAKIAEAADRAGLPPAEFVKRVMLEHLPPTPQSIEERVNARLRETQALDAHPLSPPQTLAELDAIWAQEDALLTDEERRANDDLWDEIERGINETRAESGMRQL